MTAASGASRPRPIVLVVIDGFGIGHNPAVDAIEQARMPVWHKLLDRWPHSALEASEEFVGLPEGQMGNSEVGHLNLGTGQPVLQDLPRIDKSISTGGFFSRPVLLALCARAKEDDHTLHLISLVGPGGVHANDRHLVAVAELAAREGVKRVRVHGLLDGRDTPPRSAVEYVPDLETRLAAAHPDAKIATIGGRYYAMDRDKRWERTGKGFDAIIHGVADFHAPSAVAAVEGGYARGENDEFITPTVIDGVDHGTVADGDAVLHCNFRADRARQLSHALADPDFTSFDRSAAGPMPRGILYATMTAYEADLPVQVVFGPEVVPSLAEAVSKAGWTQFHVAETEKYAHVTYFFNGGREEPWPREDRKLIPSLKIATYDLQPSMAAEGVCDALVAAIEGGKYDLIVANFANPDMVGHTGVWDATVRACETVDACLGRVADAVLAVDAGDPAAPGAVLLITADHGNADEMKDEGGNPVTKHSLNPVPLLGVGRYLDGKRLEDGRLADVTPTILEIGGLEPWPDVTGHSLLAGS
ncbi:MAG: 2,3-bisphosphoglycerate-independent phosphoglycerate mutase [Candidatus Limnocylindrales bacterium]|jgi:2,3-bisphosphoglycerate-independent phosphoglycerate mutase